MILYTLLIVSLIAIFLIANIPYYSSMTRYVKHSKRHNLVSKPLVAGFLDLKIWISLSKYFTKTNIITGIISVIFITLIKISGIPEFIFNYSLGKCFSENYIKEAIELFFSGSLFFFIRLAIRGIVYDFFNTDLKMDMGDGKDPSVTKQVLHKPISESSSEILLAGPSSEKSRSEIAQGKLPESSYSNMPSNFEKADVLPENSSSNISAVGPSNIPVNNSVNIPEVNNQETTNIPAADVSNLPDNDVDINLDFNRKYENKAINTKDKLHVAIRRVNRELERVSNDVKQLVTAVRGKEELALRRAEMERLQAEKL